MKTYEAYAGRVLARYPGGVHRYREIVQSRSCGVAELLHLGCGRDLNGMTDLFGSDVHLVGIDSDAEAVREYPREVHLGDAASIPFPASSFDLVFCEYVLEHLTNPGQVFSEVARVLRPTGYFVSVAPNIFSYKSFVAHLTPHRFHELAVRMLRRDSAREQRDVYPTLFRANSANAVRRLAHNSGLMVETIEYVDNGPTWFQRLPVLFEFGRAYHALLGLHQLAMLRCNIIFVLQKPS